MPAWCWAHATCQVERAHPNCQLRLVRHHFHFSSPQWDASCLEHFGHRMVTNHMAGLDGDETELEQSPNPCSPSPDHLDGDSASPDFSFSFRRLLLHTGCDLLSCGIAEAILVIVRTRQPCRTWPPPCWRPLPALLCLRPCLTGSPPPV